MGCWKATNSFTRLQGETELQSRAQVLKGKGIVYLLIATTNKKDEEAAARMQEVLGRVDFEEPPAPVSNC